MKDSTCSGRLITTQIQWNVEMNLKNLESEIEFTSIM